MDLVLQNPRRIELPNRRRTIKPSTKPLVPPDRLLCEMVQEHHALAVWENEGGALGKQKS